MNIFGRTNVRRIILKNADGSTYGSFSIRSSNNNVKKKRLQYNFKQVSTLIMNSKTSNSARKAVLRARQQVAMLQRKNIQNGEYDAEEVRHAIIHAQRIERIAKKKLKHLNQEEDLAKRKNSLATEFEKKEKDNIIEGLSEEEVLELSEEELKQLMEELQDVMKELEAEMADSMKDMDLSDIEVKNIKNPADLEKLKKKHRADELREILEADMKYLKAVFEKLAREKQNASSGISRGSSSQSSGSYQNSGVSLEIGGAEVPVAPAEAPVAAEGGSIDTMA